MTKGASSGIITVERALLARTLIVQPTVYLLAHKCENLPGDWLDFFVCIRIGTSVCLLNMTTVGRRFIRCLTLLLCYLVFLNLRRTNTRFITIFHLIVIIYVFLLTTCHTAAAAGEDDDDSSF